MALRVVEAFADRDLAVLVMKGPVTNKWLYRDGLARRYRDIDMLVAPHDAIEAGEILAGLGFYNHHTHVLGIHRPDNESLWTSDEGSLDLHTRIAGIPSRRAGEAWELLRTSAELFQLHGRQVLTLSEPARTMVLGLHAARRAREVQPLQDLDLGLATLPKSLWRDGADLAIRLDAGACFALGMSRSEAGSAVLREFAFRAVPTLESVLLARGAPQESFVLASHVEARRRITPTVLIAWFTTEANQTNRWRAAAALLPRLPRAVWALLAAQVRVGLFSRLSFTTGMMSE